MTNDKSAIHPTEDWRTDPATAFDNFIRSIDFVKMGYRNPIYAIASDEEGALLPLRDSTIFVYKSMFNHFRTWLSSQSISLTHVQKIHILTFLNTTHTTTGKNSRKLTSRIRLKYLRLLERVYERIGIKPNPAMQASIDAVKNKGAGKNEESAFLTSDEIPVFMNSLPVPTSWKRIRDRAMLATLIGSGVKPSELLGLWVQNIGTFNSSSPVSIQVPAPAVGGTSRWHQTKLSTFAVIELQRWMEERAIQGINCDILFPTNKNGTPLNKATLYRIAKRCFDEAQFHPTRFGGRTLRNTFAVHALTLGTPPNVVKEYLGLVDDKSMNMYLELANLGTTND